VPNEGLNGGPVNESLVLAASAEEATAQAAGAGVDARDDPSRILVAQLDVMRDHEPAGVDADQPAAEDVVTEQHLPLAALEVGKVEIFAGELNTARVHRGDPIAWDEELAPRDASDQAGHRRVAALRKSGDHIVNPAEPAAGSIDEGAVQDPGECQPDRFGGWLPGV
jgi:hypothetical protein